MRGKTVTAADLFCGAGGSSSGLLRACGIAGKQLDLLAVNHWPVAIQSHSANHPKFRHLCQSIDSVDPRKEVPSGRLNILLASPECIWHSKARGGRPINDQRRASPWHVLRWLETLRVDSVLLENVTEFRDWGPLNERGRPIKSKKGQIYQSFLSAIRAMGYQVEDQVLNAADYGDPTTRRRLFIQARRGRRPISWPTPSHDQTGMFGQKWRAAREIIDWSIKGQSIFNRKRPLAPATMQRIIAGLEKFGGPELRPFIVILRRHCDGQSIDSPIPTVCAGGTHIALAQPEAFILPHRMFDEMQVDSIDVPLRTFTPSGGSDFGLVRPFLVPFFGEREGQSPRTHSVDEPLPAVTSHGAGGLVEPFIVPFDQQSSRDGTRRVSEPLSTITTKARHGVVEVDPFIIGAGGPAQSIHDPLDTVTTKERFALVTADNLGLALDIRFRMLQPHELSAAMGFDRDYIFMGRKGDQVMQIGNAVAVNTATALCMSLLEAA